MTVNHPNNTLVLVTTGATAKLFRVEDGRLTKKDDWTPANLANDGPGGTAPVESSPKDLDEATFAKQVAERLYALAHKNAFSELILIADPQTLGQMRPLMHQEVTDKIIAEYPKTFINSPVSDIERLLSDS